MEVNTLTRGLKGSEDGTWSSLVVRSPICHPCTSHHPTAIPHLLLSHICTRHIPRPRHRPRRNDRHRRPINAPCRPPQHTTLRRPLHLAARMRRPVHRHHGIHRPQGTQGVPPHGVLRPGRVSVRPQPARVVFARQGLVHRVQSAHRRIVPGDYTRNSGDRRAFLGLEEYLSVI
ncbi:hypothetical protein H2248_000001 [Termitomyces sp. 'cryptogamus']|nr:hypothetical protein H2248_000001 [Termitomyces sp. 'cryptogamus']